MRPHTTHILTLAEKLCIDQLAATGMPITKISVEVGIKYSIIQNYLRKANGAVRSYSFCTEATYEKLAVKLNRADKIIKTVQLGGTIILQRGESRTLRQISGTVETKYPDKLIIRNRRGRVQMITLADLMDMRVAVR